MYCIRIADVPYLLYCIKEFKYQAEEPKLQQLLLIQKKE